MIAFGKVLFGNMLPPSYARTLSTWNPRFTPSPRRARVHLPVNYFRNNTVDSTASYVTAGLIMVGLMGEF